jgi:hypothetical protein
MGRFNRGGDDASEDPNHICGSVCCGLGMSPLYIPPKSSDRINGVFDYHKYSNRVFPAIVIGLDIEWDWIFAGEWKQADNTFRGVALRANYLLYNWEKVTASLVDYNLRGGKHYMFDSYSHNRTIPYLEEERRIADNETNCLHDILTPTNEEPKQ